MSSPKTLRIGVMLENVQLSDITGIDILGNISAETIDELSPIDPRLGAFRPLAPSITWYFMASTLEPTLVTPSLRFMPTVTYDDCPRNLDIVLIGGPMPTHRPAAADRFMKEAWASTRVWLTTCTGSMWLASSGVLNGHTATSNRTLLGLIKGAHPDVNWLEQRWVVDEKPYTGGEGKGELWTSGGAGAGIDMIATYALKNFDQSLVKTLALDSLEFNPDRTLGQFYTS